VIALTDQSEFLHVETGFGQSLYARLGAPMIGKDRDNGVVLRHLFFSGLWTEESVERKR
jgi:hypothetical protein